MKMFQNMPKEVDTPSQEDDPNMGADDPNMGADYSQGYAITIRVYPDGYEVTGPEPLPQSASPDSELHPQSASPDSDVQVDNPESPERIPDLGETLKQIIAITKEHPLDGDMVAQFDAGYEKE